MEATQPQPVSSETRLNSAPILIGCVAWLLLLAAGPVLKLLGLLAWPWWKAGILIWLPGAMLIVLFPFSVLLRELFPARAGS